MRGKHYGTGFERLIVACARAQGLLLVEHGVKVRYAAGRIIPMKSDVDYRLMHQGKTVFFDAKSRQGSTLPLSSLSQTQRRLVACYAKHGFMAGFLAQLRGANQVVFFSHADIERCGLRGGLAAGDGKVLGNDVGLSLRLLLA